MANLMFFSDFVVVVTLKQSEVGKTTAEYVKSRAPGKCDFVIR